MTGGAWTAEPDDPWYPLIDLATDRVAGAVRRTGEVRSDDPAVVERVAGAFRRELFLRDGEAIVELGVCYADIVIVPPDAPEHHALVFRNLALLTGYLPGDP